MRVLLETDNWILLFLSVSILRDGEGLILDRPVESDGDLRRGEREVCLSIDNESEDAGDSQRI